MIAAYIRVSSKSQSLETQRDAIQRAARARGDKILRWYSEKRSSAVVRPELERLRKDVRAGDITKVYVFKLDRISRAGIRDTLFWVNELQHCGCQLETIADGFSLGGPGGELVLAVLAWGAQMERSAIGERIAAARVRIESTGGHWGRPRGIDDTKIAKVKSLRKKGWTMQAIATALKISKSTVSVALSENGAYKRKVTKAQKIAGRPLASSCSN
jgi:DNA invertase Pin-like site-specific DNA recombinase